MKILVAYDGSETARRALVQAAELVGSGGAVEVINVIAVQPVGARIGKLSNRTHSRQRKLLQEAKAVLGEWDVAMTPMKAVGDPATEIRTAAAESGARIVVIGRGRSMRRLIHGSVTARLVRRSPCGVLVVH